MARNKEYRTLHRQEREFEQDVIDLLNRSPKANVLELEAKVRGNWRIDAILEAKGIAGWSHGMIALEIKAARSFQELASYANSLIARLSPDTSLRPQLQYVLLITNHVLSKNELQKVDELKERVFQAVARTGTKLKDFAVIDGPSLLKLANEVSGAMGQKIAEYVYPESYQNRPTVQIYNDQTVIIKRPDLTVSMTVTDKGWELPADAFVLPVGENLTFTGQVLEQVKKEYAPPYWQELTNNAENRRPKSFGVDTPFSVAQRHGQPIAAKKVIFATAYKVPYLYSRQSVSSVCDLISKEKYQTIIFPVIGGQGGGSQRALIDMFDAFLERVFKRPVNIIVPVLDEALIDIALDHIPENNRKNAIPLHDRIEVPDTVQLRNDTLDNEDCLETEAQADVFARLLMAKNVSMPFSIGLFGKWGSGKSFFMKKIREKSTELVPDQKDRVLATLNEGPYVSKPIHIEFNAWHYIDADLWASLVSHIYDEILEQVGEVNSSRLKAKEALKEIQKSADKKLDDATNTVQQIADDIKKLSKDLDEAQKENGLHLDTIFQNSALKKIKDELIGFGVDKKYFNSLDELAQISAGIQEVTFGLDPFLPKTFKRCNWLRGIGYFLLLAVPSGVFWGMNWVLSGEVENMQSIVASLLTTASASLVYVKDRVGKIRKYVKSASEVYSLAKQEIKKKSSDQSEIEKLIIQIEAQKEALALAEKEVINASQEKVRASQGGLVYDFILERRKDPCYQDNLGIVSVIRKDFEDLKERLTIASENTDEEGEPLVDRIILYIDDLDRCEPGRVVEVLQAVHLLLAFDLFAVVVAVDDRWLERALYDRYIPNWLNLDDRQLKDCDFEPHNYLEKIFQIPFHVPDMDTEGYSRLVDNLTADLLRQETLTSPDTSADTDMSDETDKEDDAEKSEDKGQEHKEKYKSNREKQAVTDEQEVIKSFELEAHEIDFLKDLGGFASTPRTTKRLINLYILLRVQTATKGPNEISKFADNEIGEYRAAALLLAFVVEKPALLEKFSEKFHTNKYAQLLSGNLIEALNEVVGKRLDLTELQKVHGELPDWKVFEKWLPEIKRFSFPWKKNGFNGNGSQQEKQS